MMIHVFRNRVVRSPKRPSNAWLVLTTSAFEKLVARFAVEQNPAPGARMRFLVGHRKNSFHILTQPRSAHRYACHAPECVFHLSVLTIQVTEKALGIMESLMQSSVVRDRDLRPFPQGER